MSASAALDNKKSQNFLKVRVGHGTCPRVPKRNPAVRGKRTAGFLELTVYKARRCGQIRQHKIQVDRQKDQEIDQNLFPEIIFLLHICRWLHRHPPILSSRYVWYLP